MTFDFNFLTVVAAAVVSMLVGFLWYSPVLFGKPWMELIGVSMDNMKMAQKEMGKMYALSFVATLLTAFVLYHTVTSFNKTYNDPTMLTSVLTALWMWLGFVMPVQLTEVLFGGKKWRLFAINTGYQLASLLGMAVVMSVL